MVLPELVISISHVIEFVTTQRVAHSLTYKRHKHLINRRKDGVVFGDVPKTDNAREQ